MGNVKGEASKKLREKHYIAPTLTELGVDLWQATQGFSVADLKDEINGSKIENKPEAITMMNGAFQEYFSNRYPEIPTCYLGVLDPDGELTTVEDLLKKGQTSSITAYRLSHTPTSFSDDNLDVYRIAIQSGKLQCAVSDVEFLFRKALPLGASVFRHIFRTTGFGHNYRSLSTYKQVIDGLDFIRESLNIVNFFKEGEQVFPKLRETLERYNIEGHIPNPGFEYDKIVFDVTTKFEVTGDRAIDMDIARVLSGLDNDGFETLMGDMLPKYCQAQHDFGEQRGIYVADGKVEVVTLKGMPYLTDFGCTFDENRTMLKADGLIYPFNKDVQRIAFIEHGIYTAIDIAKLKADEGDWRPYFRKEVADGRVNLQAAVDESCRMMNQVVTYGANQMLGDTIFSCKNDDNLEKKLKRRLKPYASRLYQRQAK